MNDEKRIRKIEKHLTKMMVQRNSADARRLWVEMWRLLRYLRYEVKEGE